MCLPRDVRERACEALKRAARNALKCEKGVRKTTTLTFLRGRVVLIKRLRGGKTTASSFILVYREALFLEEERILLSSHVGGAVAVVWRGKEKRTPLCLRQEEGRKGEGGGEHDD